MTSPPLNQLYDCARREELLREARRNQLAANSRPTGTHLRWPPFGRTLRRLTAIFETAEPGAAGAVPVPAPGVEPQGSTNLLL